MHTGWIDSKILPQCWCLLCAARALESGSTAATQCRSGSYGGHLCPHPAPEHWPADGTAAQRPASTWQQRHKQAGNRGTTWRPETYARINKGEDL